MIVEARLESVREALRPLDADEVAGVEVGTGAEYRRGEPVHVNRRGVVFVPAVAGRDLASLAVRVAAASAALFAELLELDD